LQADAPTTFAELEAGWRAFGAVACGAYGVADGGLVDWWADRLPRPAIGLVPD
jgi:hypothetical protein